MKPFSIDTFKYCGILLSCFNLFAEETVSIAWDPHPSPFVESFVIYSSYDTNGYWGLVDIIPSSITNYTIGNLEEGKKIYFAVSAKTADAESFRSESVYYIPPFSAPKSLKLVSVLQISENLNGPWEDYITYNSVHPIVNVPAGKFYRSVLRILPQ